MKEKFIESSKGLSYGQVADLKVVTVGEDLIQAERKDKFIYFDISMRYATLIPLVVFAFIFILAALMSMR